MTKMINTTLLSFQKILRHCRLYLHLKNKSNANHHYFKAFLNTNKRTKSKNIEKAFVTYLLVNNKKLLNHHRIR